MELRLGTILERSLANGPGERFVIWVQGCTLACPGCFNPELTDFNGGALISTPELIRRIHAAPGIRGITISGGEPLEQPEAVADILKRLDRRLDSVIFTGCTWQEITADSRKLSAVKCADLVVAGRYIRELASDENPWTGSSNQTVHALTGRIRVDEFPSCRVEAQISPAGKILRGGPFLDDFVVAPHSHCLSSAQSSRLKLVSGLGLQMSSYLRDTTLAMPFCGRSSLANFLALFKRPQYNLF
ncbi:MAG: radical SAM protein [Elusimicrobia bacterium]|nr:radical SAM protein [Elusimicrobiota bacterium]